MFRQSPRPTREQRIEARAERMAAQAQTCLPRRASTYSGGTVGPAPAARQKVPGKVRQSIRDAAHGEPCLLRIPGVCTGDPEKTIWSHARWGYAGRGKGTKALDICGALACTDCDAVYDGQAKPPPGMTRDDVDALWMEAHLRSLVRLAQKGLL